MEHKKVKIALVDAEMQKVDLIQRELIVQTKAGLGEKSQLNVCLVRFFLLSFACL